MPGLSAASPLRSRVQDKWYATGGHREWLHHKEALFCVTHRAHMKVRAALWRVRCAWPLGSCSQSHGEIILSRLRLPRVGSLQLQVCDPS